MISKKSLLVVAAIMSSLCSTMELIEVTKKHNREDIEVYKSDRDRALIQELLAENPADIYDFNPDYKKRIATLVEKIENQEIKTMVQLVDDRPIGFISYIPEQMKFFGMNFGKMGFIHYVGIAKQYRGKRYAKVLFRYVIDDLKDQAKGMQIVTTNEYPQLSKLGFTKVGFFWRNLYSLKLYPTRRM